MWSKLGIVSIGAGFFIGVFSGISNFMQADNFWVHLTLSKITGDFSESIVTLIPVQAVQNVLQSIVYEIPLGWIAVGLSVVFFFISFFVKEG